MTRLGLLFLAAILLVAGTATSARADKKRGDVVGLDKGKRFYTKTAPSSLGDYAEESDSMGTIARAAAWTVTAVDAGWLVLERTTGGLVETIAVRAKSISEKPDSIAKTKASQATIEQCRTDGLCNIAIKKRREFPDPSFSRPVLRAKKRTLLDHSVKVCKLGPLYKLEPDRMDWLSPAAVNWEPALGYTYELEKSIDVLAEGKTTEPPACPEKRNNRNKIVVGGNNSDNKRPQMGLFILTKERAAEVDKEMSKSLKRGYDRAMEVATKKWPEIERSAKTPSAKRSASLASAG